MAQAEATSPGQNMIKYIKSNDDWVTLMNEDKLVVTNFTSSGWASCSFVTSFFEAMPKDYPNVIFAIVDLDKKDEIETPFDVDIDVLPIFQFYNKGEKVTELAGADASVDKLRADIAAHDLDEAIEEEKYEEENYEEESNSEELQDLKAALPRQNFGFGRTKKKSALPHRTDRTFNVLQKGVGNKKNHARAGNKKNSIQSLTEEYLRLSLQFESALIQHKLAMEYFDFRSYYFVFLPVTLIATSITIIGFLIAGNTQTQEVNGTNGDDGAAADPVGDFDPILTGKWKQILSLVVGILGAISTLFNAIGKRTNYQSQSDMHRSAVKALEKICLSVEFEREWFERKIFGPENASSNGGKKLSDDELLGAADLKTHQASFKAMLDACCDSPVPYDVSQAFTLLEQIFCLEALEQGDSFNPLMYHYHKLWKEYSTYRLWPLKAPSIKVFKKIKQWEKERANLYRVGYDEEGMWGCSCCGKYWQIRNEALFCLCT